MPVIEQDLHEATSLHQRGELEKASSVYGAILRRDPENPEALHLLGVVACQRSDWPRAVELISRAVARRPSAAVFHSNLAEAYRGLGQFDRAATCCRTALALHPNYAEAANNLGLALLGQNDYASAADQFRAALRLRPQLAILHSNLGNAMRLQGKRLEAIGNFRRAVELDPNLADAHNNLGQALLEQYRRQEALHHCQEAVRLAPDFAEAHGNLGNVLRELGRFEEARASYAESLLLYPHAALVYNNMGQALQEEGELREAIGWYRQGLQRDPNLPRIHCNLASAFGEQENFSGAQDHYRIALRLEPNSAEAHNGLAGTLHELGKYPEAVAEYREVLRLEPGYAHGHCSLGVLLEELGQLDEALGCFREAINHDPENIRAHAMMATMLRGKLPDDLRERIDQFLRRRHLGPGKRAALHFGIAQVHDARGEYTEAATHLERGNGLLRRLHEKQGQNYDPEQHTRFVDRLIAQCTPEFFERVRSFGLDTERPIFVVGLPRSGTTLTEQILASHSQVYGAGELSYARECFDALPAELNRPGPPIGCLEHLDHATVQRLGQWHLDRLAELNADKPRIVDKMPDNYSNLGLIVTLFPHAKIVHCRRDLRDIAVSCWMTNFRHLRWSVDRDHIASRFLEYRRLMDHWKRVLPVPIFEVDYEDTVADLEGVARRLTAWCGLEWEPQCLAFHETKRPVRTASVTQVRQPIYTRSVARWKHYEASLGEVFARLEPANWSR